MRDGFQPWSDDIVYIVLIALSFLFLFSEALSFLPVFDTLPSYLNSLPNPLLCQWLRFLWQSVERHKANPVLNRLRPTASVCARILATGNPFSKWIATKPNAPLVVVKTNEYAFVSQQLAPLSKRTPRDRLGISEVAGVDSFWALLKPHG